MNFFVLYQDYFISFFVYFLRYLLLLNQCSINWQQMFLLLLLVVLMLLLRLKNTFGVVSFHLVTLGVFGRSWRSSQVFAVRRISIKLTAALTRALLP